VIGHGTPLKATEPSDRVQALQGYITALENGDADIRVLQKLALLCSENPVAETPSPPLSPDFEYPNSPSPFLESSRSLMSLHSDIWDHNKNFERLFNALIQFLDPMKASH
jgi:CLIP-associating protein 1/2